MCIPVRAPVSNRERLLCFFALLNHVVMPAVRRRASSPGICRLAETNRATGSPKSINITGFAGFQDRVFVPAEKDKSPLPPPLLQLPILLRNSATPISTQRRCGTDTGSNGSSGVLSSPAEKHADITSVASADFVNTVRDRR